MRNLLIFLLILFAFQSCLIDGERVEIIPYHLLTDNSSKVWILKSERINDKDESVIIREDLMTIVFYKDLSFVMNRLKNFGEISMLSGSFQLSEDKNSLMFNWFDGSVEKFHLIKLQNNLLVFSGKLKGQKITYIYTTMDKRVYEYDIENEQTIESSSYY